MVRLLGLNHVLVQVGGPVVAYRAAKGHELEVAHLGDGLAGEGSSGDALGGGAQAAQVLVERAVAVGQGIEAGQVLAELRQTGADQPVVLHLVAALQGQAHLGVHLGGRGHPDGGQLGGLDLALQGQAQQVDHVDPTLRFRLQGLGLSEQGEEPVHLCHQLLDELQAVHAGLL
jgi:hypothetical protein